MGAASINVPTPTGSPNQPSVMGVIAADLMTTDLIPKEDIPLDVVASKVTRMTAVRFFKTLSKINDDVKPLLDIIPGELLWRPKFKFSIKNAFHLETHQNGCIIFYVMDLENPNDPFSRVQDIGRWKINLRQGTICELRGRQDHCHTNAVSIYADDKTMLKILQTKTSLQALVT